SLFVTGDVALTGGAGGSASIVAGQTLNVSTPGNVKLTAGTGSKALLQGTTVNLGAAGAPVRSLSLFGGDSAGADSRIAASGTANLFVSGDVTLAGNAGGSAIIDGGNLNVGTAAAPVSNLSLAGG